MIKFTEEVTQQVIKGYMVELMMTSSWPDLISQEELLSLVITTLHKETDN